MVVDYSQHAVSKYQYISDAGYKWNIISEPETNDIHPEVKNVKIGGFKKLLLLMQNSDNSFIISTHPHRWMSSALMIYLKINLFRMVRGVVLVFRCIPGIDVLLNKFYYLAKKI